MLLAFEQGLLKSPQYIPMFLRMKLALTSSALAPAQWEGLTPHEKAELLIFPGIKTEDHAAFAARVHEVLGQHHSNSSETTQSADNASWSHPGKPDAAVTARLEAEKIPPLTEPQWNDLSPLQRFTLITLARTPDLQEYLAPALREFRAGE